MCLGCSSAITCCPAAAKCILPSTTFPLLCLSALLLSCAVLHKTALACYHLLSTCQVGLCLLLLLYSDHCAVLHMIKTLFCSVVPLFTLCCAVQVHCQCGLLCFCCAAQVRLTSGSFPCSGPTNLSTAPHNPRPPTSSSPPPPPSSRTSAVSWATSPCPAV